MATNLAKWRASRFQNLTLPSGLEVTVRKLKVTDLASKRQVPVPLHGQVQALLNGKSAIPAEMDIDAFAEQSDLLDTIAAAILVDPPLSDEPDDDHLTLAELSFDDRLFLFNWAHEEAAQVATFPEPARDGPRPPRGRQRLPLPPEHAAALSVDGLAD